MLSTATQPRREWTGSPSPFLGIALAGVAVSAAYVLSMLAMTQGHFVPQVSDLYLVAQYAKGFAEGHPFQYNPGEAPTTGATSLLHTAFLATAHLVGFRGEALIAFAILSGGVFMLLTALQTRRAAIALGGREPVALLAGLLVVLNGPLAWSFHYGSDIALVLFLASWLFASFVEGNAFLLPACLLAAARPEAAILVTGLGFAAFMTTRDGAMSWRGRLRFAAPSATAAAVLLGLRLVTGSAAHTSFSQKLLMANWGNFSAAVLSIEYWTDLLRGLLLGFYPSTQRVGFATGMAPYYGPPLLLILVLVALTRGTPGLRRAVWFLEAALVTAIAATPSIYIGIHYNRYVLFVLPPLLALASLGLDETANRFAPPGEMRAALFGRLRIAALAFGLLSVSRFALVYLEGASDTYARDEAILNYINRNFPTDATFLNNGTAIEYRTGRRSVNLSGVVTPEFAGILPVETEAAAFEVLSRQAKETFPPFLIAPENWAAESNLRLLIGGPPVFRTASMAGPELAIYPTRRDYLGRQFSMLRAEAPTDAALTDSLDVADPADERRHSYGFVSASGTRRLFAALKLDTYQGDGRNSGTEIADGGRVIFGSETFEVATPGAGDVWVVMRTNASPSARIEHPSGERRSDLEVGVNRVRITTGNGSTDLMTTPLAPGWTETVYRLPAALAGASVTRLSIEGRYSSYAYWIFRAPR